MTEVVRRSGMLLRAILLAGLAALLMPQVAWADIAVGDRAPELDIAKTEAGKPFKLKGVRGQWLLLTFGASWCQPCKAELPAWDGLAKAFAGKVTFVAINIDNEVAKGKKFNDKLGLKHMLRLYLPAENAAADDLYATGTFPSTFIIDPRGVIRDIHKGYASGDAREVKKTLDLLLSK
jgi:peroxiredoxin